jgi:hypothetical protein
VKGAKLKRSKYKSHSAIKCVSTAAHNYPANCPQRKRTEQPTYFSNWRWQFFYTVIQRLRLNTLLCTVSGTVRNCPPTERQFICLETCFDLILLALIYAVIFVLKSCNSRATTVLYYWKDTIDTWIIPVLSYHCVAACRPRTARGDTFDLWQRHCTVHYSK